MLQSLKLEHVGPASALALELSPRINLIAGDNGLGKTFVLDVAWWALTRIWARGPAIPHRPPAQPSIEYQYVTQSGRSHRFTSEYGRRHELWLLERKRPPVPSLVLYAQVDGGFSAWDPARNDWKDEGSDRPDAYLFSPDEVWNGLPVDEPVKLCNGLISDWATWQLENGEAFAQLRRVLETLSPADDERLEPGPLLPRLSLRDSRKHPTIRTPDGRDVPLVHASAGVRRIVALAYLLVWSWQEHASACALRGDEPVRRIVFLIDEIEAHLHPKWQRRIVPTLLAVMDALMGGHDISVQLILATHSPLVLASIEPHFDEELDAVHHFDVSPHGVTLARLPWSKQGDVVNWLVSDVFGLTQGRSLEAERAIEAAEALMRGELEALPEGLTTRDAIHQELLRALAGHDAFWPRWVVWVEHQETEP